MMSDCEAAKKGPVFIVGAPRSGTTLLQYMLRSHPVISIPSGESHFMVPLYRDRERFGDLRQHENIKQVLAEMYRLRQLFLDTDLPGMTFDIELLATELHAQGVNTMPGIFAALFEKNARGEGKCRWGDKTPPYTRHMPVLREMFPEAQFVHVIRDARDCVQSMLRRKYDLGTYNSCTAAEIWRMFVDAGQASGRAFGVNVYHELTYENLLVNPATELRRICGFLGEDFSPDMVNFRGPSTQGKTPLLSQSLQTSNSEKWRQTMPVRQQKLVEAVAGEAMARNGYPLVTGVRPLPALWRTLYAGHNRFAWWLDHRLRLFASRFVTSSG